MTKPFLSNYFILLFLTALLAISCNAQSEENLQKTTPIGPKQLGTEYPLIVKVHSSISAGAENVHSSIMDNSGSLWFGTTSHGVFVYDGSSFTNYTVKDGLKSDRIWCILQDNDGNILLGTDLGITMYNGSSLSDFAYDGAIYNKRICSLYQDSKGIIWIGICDHGLYSYDGTTFTHITSQEGIENANDLTLKNINAMKEDKSGNLWITSWAPTDEGVIRYDGNSLKKFTSEHGLNDSLIHCVIEDKAGTLWFGSRDHGVFTYDGNSFIHVSDFTGPGYAAIYSILEDMNGNIWFTTETNGVYRYDGKTFTNFTTEDGLINNSVFSIVEDEDGNIWFGTRNVGLCRYDGESFVNFSE